MSRLIITILLCITAVTLQAQLTRFVNPLIGTDRMGHTYPGATVPFGSVQLSPETDTLPYEMKAGIIKTSTNTAQATNTAIRP